MSEARDVWVKLGELSAVVGMMEASLSSKTDQYANVMEGWGERLDVIVRFADQQIQEIIDFGDFYDDE